MINIYVNFSMFDLLQLYDYFVTLKSKEFVQEKFYCVAILVV